MKRKKSDFYIGLISTSLIMAVFYFADGIWGIINLIYISLMYMLITTLWFKSAPTAKTIAFLLMPIILFSYFLPKKAKRIIATIEKATIEKNNPSSKE